MPIGIMVDNMLGISPQCQQLVQMTTAIVDSLQDLDIALKGEDSEKSLEKLNALLQMLQDTLEIIDPEVLGR
jgi:hypothetical protein